MPMVAKVVLATVWEAPKISPAQRQTATHTFSRDTLLNAYMTFLLISPQVKPVKTILCHLTESQPLLEKTADTLSAKPNLL